MSAHIVIGCDADWHGMPCRGAHPQPADESRYPAQTARLRAADAGWVETVDGRDLCPAHARTVAEHTVARLAAEAPALTREQAISSALPYLPAEWHAHIDAITQPEWHVTISTTSSAVPAPRIELGPGGLVAQREPHPDINAHLAAMRREAEERREFLAAARPLRLAVSVLELLTRRGVW